ncbi:MAG: WecB/TagA/CpsF family glycosyltransferase [Syntrophomonadaceae bacterium]|nr:WecB/TagA/CpsF family glycosyltransferase [Syntrophomonadaceae bacterium]
MRMNMPERAKVLGSYVDLLDMNGVMEKLGAMVEGHSTQQVVTLNAEIAYLAQRDHSLQAIINSADLVTPDGIGIVWAARLQGYKIRQRVTGIELTYRLSEEAAKQGWKVFLLGALPGIADQAADCLQKSLPGLQIVGQDHGYHSSQEMPAVIEKINQLQPDILLVALGAPRQEFWIHEHKNNLKVKVCIGIGGSLDVLAGEKKRAPELFIRLNLEWLYRLLSEPARIKRQVNLPLFVLQVLKNKYLPGK